MPLFMRKALLAVKKETTYGTDPTPAGTNAYLVRNLSITPLANNSASRDLVRPYFGNFENIALDTHVECQFEVELQSSGTKGTAPAFGDALLACGFAATTVATTSVTYTPVSSNFDAVTIYFNMDGVLHKMTGSRGTVSLSVARGAIPTLSFSFQGLYSTPTDTAALTPTFTAFKTPLGPNVGNTPTFTLHGASSPMESLSIDLANSLVFRSLPGGSEQVLLTDRKPTGSVSFEATTVAVKDWWTISKNNTLGAMQLIHGTADGFKVEINAPKVQLDGLSYSDSDGIAMLNSNLILTPNSGNDELTIAFK
jgi:hypothetical protein